MKNEHKISLTALWQVPLRGLLANASIFIDLPARFPFRLPATYHVKVENTYTPEAISSGRAEQSAFRLVQPACS
jgi:hypothetical protein